MTTRLDTVVIGGGAMGSATAWALANRGREVTLLEQFTPGHKLGASHGSTRNLNLGYREPAYVQMLVEALELWKLLGEQSGTDPIARTGTVNHGYPERQRETIAALSGTGIRAEELSAAEAADRWRGIRFEGPVLHLPDGGQLNPDTALPSFQRVATAAGARIRHGVKVTGLRILADDDAELTLHSEAGTEVIRARTVVSTAGAWTGSLLGPALAGRAALPSLTVTQEQPMHFAPADPGASWPGFNHTLRPGTPGFEYAYSSVYGMFTPGEGIKAGWHGTGAITDPEKRSFTAEPAQRLALREYVRNWLPGADPDVFTEISCTYTNTADEAFILDRIGPVVIGAGFSGQGFKFTPVIGRILADLVDGSAPAPAEFAAGRRITGSSFALARSQMPGQS